jgi:hypothetical protein
MADEIERVCRTCRFWAVHEDVRDIHPSAPCIADPPQIVPEQSSVMGSWPVTLGIWRCGRWMTLPKAKPPKRDELTY